jgi:peroxiredoxin Q/BCP
MHSIPEIDTPVPFFNVTDSQGKKISPESLRGYPFILYFYPKDDTPGCTTEACSFRDIRDQFNPLKAQVIGISPDSDTSHNQFITKHNLNFPLISDPNHELCSLFGVWEEKKTGKKTYWGVTRTTFMIDGQGIIRWIEKPVQVNGHAERILEALKNLPHAFKP